MGSIVDPLRRALRPAPPDPRLGRGVPSAVVVPIVDGARPSVLFTERSHDVRHHKGEVSFPGGARHPDDPSLLATALRETEEEVGIPRGEVDVVGALPPQHTFVSGFVVVPFVGVLAAQPSLRPDPAEVSAVVEVELSRLADVERLVERDWRGTSYHTYVYDIEGTVVWGLTGRILHGLLRILEREGWM